MLVVLASHNRAKLAELKQLLPSWVEVKTAADLGVESPEETGTTFHENAFLKARAVAAAGQVIAVADDSGLEVDALGGRPGVRSSRYAGEPCDDAKNNALLLRDLRDVAPNDRTARFRSVVAVVAPDGKEFSAEGTIEGTILDAPRGCGGFGYDPLFLPLGFNRTLAQLSLDEKNEISHRAVAIKAVSERLTRLLEAYQHAHSPGNNTPKDTSR